MTFTARHRPVARTLALAFAASAPLSSLAADHVVLARVGPMRFEPNTLTIAPGDTVTFKNVGGGFHNVISTGNAVTTFRCANGCDGDGAGGNGAAATNDWTATVTFPTVGTAPFKCEIHGSMTGTITIAQPDLIFFDGFELPAQ